MMKRKVVLGSTAVDGMVNLGESQQVGCPDLAVSHVHILHTPITLRFALERRKGLLEY